MIILLLFLLGLTVGSFLNVVIYRLPKRRTFIKGRSKCANCDKEISWYDLVPILSFFLLAGKCRHCGERISWRYPIVELYSGFVFLLSFWFLRLTIPEIVFAIFLLESFLVLALIDLENMILPDSIISTILIVALAFGFFEKYILKNAQVRIISFQNLLTALIWLGIFFCLWLFSKGKWMGLGDAKFVFLIGLVFGPWDSIMVMYVAILAGAILGLALLVLKRATLQSKLPLGTFISFAASFYIFAGSEISNNLGEFFKYLKPLFKF